VRVCCVATARNRFGDAQGALSELGVLPKPFSLDELTEEGVGAVKDSFTDGRPACDLGSAKGDAVTARIPCAFFPQRARLRDRGKRHTGETLLRGSIVIFQPFFRKGGGKALLIFVPETVTPPPSRGGRVQEGRCATLANPCGSFLQICVDQIVQMTSTSTLRLALHEGCAGNRYQLPNVSARA